MVARSDRRQSNVAKRSDEILAWAYGSTGDHTGISIYSGLDADAFTDQVSPNYAIKALATQLEAPFQRSPDSACAPNCGPPPAPTGTNPNGTTSGLGSTGSSTFALCTFNRRPPLGWVRGPVTLSLRLSIASGIRGHVISQSGRVLAATTATTPGQLRLPVNTRLLASNRQHSLRVVVFVNAAQACSLPATLKVDNQAPRPLSIRIRAKGGKWQLTVKPSEAVRLSILRNTRTLRTTNVRAGTTAVLNMANNPHGTTLILTDRAGNRTSRTFP